MRPYTVIVPVYNGADRIPSLVDELRLRLPGDGEILLADDGSRDETWSVMRTMCDRRIRGIRLDGNHGQQAAILAALTGCPGRDVVTMDDDGSHPPQVLSAMLGMIAAGADLVYADPPRRPGGPVRRSASRIHQLHLNLLTGTPPAIRVGSFRAFTSELAARILEEPWVFPYFSAVALSLRPRPHVRMCPTPPWPAAPTEGRFRAADLLRLEWNLARSFGLGRRYRRRCPAEPIGAVVRRWVADRCGS